MSHFSGLIYGPNLHYLDHLAPLCALLQIPLVVTEEKLASLATTFYPDLQVLHFSKEEVAEQVLYAFEGVISCLPKVLIEQIFFFAQLTLKKKIHSIWCPHGHSDKGKNSPFFEALQDEELLLTYGKRLESALKEKGVLAPTFQVGNYRLFYYEKHKQFYKKIFELKKYPPLLYAPTWQDGEKNSSFPKMWKILLQAPSSFALTVKLHPHLYEQYPAEIQLLKEVAHVNFLEDFPPIYPLLDQMSLYIGDMSSIGYDFLAFNRPMLLLRPSELSPSYLAEENYDMLFEECKKALVPPATLYQETFGKSWVEEKRSFSL